MSETDFEHLTGRDLKAWRKANNYTHEQLLSLLSIKSRQTIINWEQTEKILPRILRLALMALECLPDKTYSNVGRRERTGNRPAAPIDTSSAERSGAQ
jgi:transcriptional regulator with XRE-family HTH domain